MTEYLSDAYVYHIFNLIFFLFAEVAKGMVPPEKTPATSALFLRKKQIEEQKAALAAKNVGVVCLSLAIFLCIVTFFAGCIILVK